MEINLSRPLRNHWYALRHGQSKANVAQVVVSDPANGCNGHGLTDIGREQFRQSLSANALAKLGAAAPDHQALLYSSDFARAIESATVAAELLQIEREVQIDTRLRERYFGRYELGDASAYEKVWLADRSNMNTAENGVEPVREVALRMTELVETLEQQHHNQTIVLVSHGDPLQILECVFSNHPPARHRDLAPLENAELRLLGAP